MSSAHRGSTPGVANPRKEPAADRQPTVYSDLDFLVSASPTTGRLLLLASAGICLSLLVGKEACVLGSPPGCRADSIRLGVVWYMWGTAAVVALAGLVIVVVTPSIVGWRRRMRVASRAFAGAAIRAGVLAREMGVHPVPSIMVGSARQRDAFAFGRPGDYRIALPMALALRYRDNVMFDAVLRHELAHVRNGDIAWVWLARSVWRVGYPLLAVATLAMILFSILAHLWGASDDLRSRWAQLTWQLVLLWLFVAVLLRATIRSREHDADLLAARGAVATRQLCAVISGLPERRPGRWRRFRSLHPSPAERLAVLRAPRLALRATFTDGFTGAYLGAFILPTVHVTVLLLPFHYSGQLGIAFLAIVTAPVALMLGRAVGVGLWRTAIVESAASRWHRPVGPCVGVALGLVVGLFAAFESSGAYRGFDGRGAAYMLAVAASGFGTVIIAASLGQLWAETLGQRRSRRPSWRFAVLVDGLVFLSLLLSSTFFLTLVMTDRSDEPFSYIVTDLWTAVVPVWPVPVIVAWMLAARRKSAATLQPRAMQPGGPATGIASAVGPSLPSVAVAGVLAGILGLIAFFCTGLPTLSGDRAFAALDWCAAAAGLATWLGCCVRSPRIGPAIGLLVGIIATTTFSVSLWGLYLASNDYGARLTPDFALNIVSVPTTLLFELILVGAPVALLLWRLPRRDIPSGLLVKRSALLSPAAVATITLAVGHFSDGP